MNRFWVVVIFICILHVGCSKAHKEKAKEKALTIESSIQSETLHEDSQNRPLPNVSSEVKLELHKESNEVKKPFDSKKPLIAFFDSEKNTQEAKEVLNNHQQQPESSSIKKVENNSHNKGHQTTYNDEKFAYNEALNTYEKRNYPKAITLFDQFMERYPKSHLIPNALYWKAECLYSQHQYAEAILMFKSVIAKYPKHAKAAAALLKIGMSYNALGDQDNALLHYRALYEDYPKSMAVKRAKELGIKP